MTHLVQVDGSLPENKWALLHNVLKAWAGGCDGVPKSRGS